MRESIVAKRYAEAFVAYGRQSIGLPKVIEDMARLTRTMFDNPEFRVFLHSPEISYHEKCAFVDRALKAEFAPETGQFLKLLIDKRRIDLLEEIADYIRVHYAHGGAVNALVKTSYPMDLDLAEALKEKLEKKYQTKFNLYMELDPSLHGGVQLTIGNTVIDGSVRHRLEELRENLRAVRIA